MIQTTPCPCPHCGHLLSGATNSTGEGPDPSPGDPTVCINCARLLLFNDDMTVRMPTLEERRELLEAPEVRLAIVAMKRVIHWRGARR